MLPAVAVPGPLLGPRVGRTAVWPSLPATRSSSSPDRPPGTNGPSTEPDTFDIGREPSLALGFGFGIHTCLGAALARMESRLAIEALARRWPRLEVDEAGCRRVQMSNVAGYSRVPVHRAT